MSHDNLSAMHFPGRQHRLPDEKTIDLHPNVQHLKLVYCQFVLELRVHDKRRVEKDCKVHWDLLS